MEKLKTVSQLLWLALKLLASREIMVQNVKNNSKEALEIKIENLRKNREKEKDEPLSTPWRRGSRPMTRWPTG